ncbi:MAG: hypothetical protein EAZ53_13030 [Bacteroidetes bacterium]|nr:MAG: hypothetical protein EAZ53_13030 [Bacteroidota bacterium]
MLVYQVKISLLNQQKPTYRTIQFDEDATFWEMAQDIQTAFALSGFESWMFMVNENLILSEIDEDLNEVIDNGSINIEDADDYELKDLLQTNQDGIVFSYINENEDENDNKSFEFTIELESIFSVKDNSLYPVCIDAKGDHPDEDFLDLSTLTKKQLLMHNATHLLDIEEINSWLKDEEFMDDSDDDFGFLDNPDEPKNEKDGGFSIPFSLN